jgi:hypothetical protein
MRHKKGPQPGEDRTQVLADCGEDGVRDVAVAAAEVAAEPSAAEFKESLIVPINSSP